MARSVSEGGDEAPNRFVLTEKRVKSTRVFRKTPSRDGGEGQIWTEIEEMDGEMGVRVGGERGVMFPILSFSRCK